MAIELGAETQTVIKKERTAHAEISAPANGDYNIRVFREIAFYDEKSKLVRTESGRRISRAAKDIMEEKYKLHDGTTITSAQIIEGLALAFDSWSKEEIEK